MKPARTICHLSYVYVGDMAERRGPYRAEHLALLQGLEGHGLLLAGAHIDPIDSAEFLFTDETVANDFLQRDAYRANGLVAEYKVRKLAVVAGDYLPS